MDCSVLKSGINCHKPVSQTHYSKIDKLSNYLNLSLSVGDWLQLLRVEFRLCFLDIDLKRK